MQSLAYLIEPASSVNGRQCSSAKAGVPPQAGTGSAKQRVFPMNGNIELVENPNHLIEFGQATSS